VIFENSQSVFEHPQHFLVFEVLMSNNLQLCNPFPLPVNNSAAFGYVPSGQGQPAGHRDALMVLLA